MRTIRQAIEDTLHNDPVMRHALAGGVLSLRRAAAQLKDTIETRTKKEVTVDAIAMALSRMQRDLKLVPDAPEKPGNLEVEYVAIHSGLMAMTFAANERTAAAMSSLNKLVTKKQRFFTLTQSSNEVTVVIDRALKSGILGIFGKRTTSSTEHVAAIGIRFHRRFLHTPGFLSAILREIALHGIDVIELASTATELTIYVNEEDAHRATDALLWRFSPELKARKRK